MKKLYLMAFCLSLAMLTSRAESNGMADFKLMKYGFFVHYVWGGAAYPVTVNRDGSAPAGLDDLADRFDAVGLANDLAAMKVEYVVFTAWHAGMHLLYPSAAMNRWVTGHSTRRDVLRDLIKACKARGIKVLLYTHPRDGHDLVEADQIKTGWGSGKKDGADPDWSQFDFKKWNDFINEVYGELLERCGKDIVGLYLDEGSGAGDSYRVVDYPRLRQTIKSQSPNLLMMQNNYGNLYTCDIGNKEVFYSGDFASPDGDRWTAMIEPISIVVGSIFWAATPQGTITPANPNPKVGFNKFIPYTPEAMFRYTVLQAAVNTDGGGTLWAAGPYPGGGWESTVKERMTALGRLVEPVAESIKQTYPSTSYTPASKNISALVWGVATKSADGRHEYLHVLRPPTNSATLKLPPPADGKCFTKATLLPGGRKATLKQDAAGLTLTLPKGVTWDKLDTVIRLQVGEKK